MQEKINKNIRFGTLAELHERHMAVGSGTVTAMLLNML
jgi:hypothetical protein